MNILEIKDLHYETENTSILKGISLEVEEGDCISLIGASGSGKSTILKLCADLIPISKGAICYREKSYTMYNPLELRKKISYCVQIPHLFGEKVYENLEFPFKVRKSNVDDIRILEFLKRFNLEKSILQKEIKSLSGGEKQRLAIIRNLLFTPDILLLDEVTSALDKENAEKVEDYIKELNRQGVTILWITHSIEQSKRIFNKRIVISEGKVQKMEEFK